MRFLRMLTNSLLAGALGAAFLTIIVLQLNCAWPMLTPLARPFFAGGTYSFSVAATMRNEGF